MSVSAQDIGGVTAEAMPFIGTTVVDGEIFASTEALLDFIHRSQDALVDSLTEIATDFGVESQEFIVAFQRADSMAVAYALLDSLLHALEDREGLESLSPGDFR